MVPAMKSDRFVEAVKARSREQLEAAFAPDARFLSPVVFRPYEGRDLVLLILTEGAMKVFGDDFHYVHRLESEDAAALIFKATVDGLEVDGLDLLTFDSEGLITELKVMVRPMTALNALAEAMGRRFEALGIAPPV
jgi:hypothetical protein